MARKAGHRWMEHRRRATVAGRAEQRRGGYEYAEAGRFLCADWWQVLGRTINAAASSIPNAADLTRCNALANIS